MCPSECLIWLLYYSVSVVVSAGGGLTLWFGETLSVY